jgi:arylsulfatase A-like enzyme
MGSLYGPAYAADAAVKVHIGRPGEKKKYRAFGLEKTFGHDEKNFSISNKDILVELYTAEVRYVDDSLGQVLETLNQYEIWDDTIIIVSADHGEEHFEHGVYDHNRTLYDEIIAVPLIIHFPDKGSGTVETRSSIIDIPTTVLAYIGSPETASMEGNNLLEFVENDVENIEIYADRTNYDHRAISVRTDEFLLIYYSRDITNTDEKKESFELYRYKDDPYQRENVITEYPEVADALTAELAVFSSYLESEAAEVDGGLLIDIDETREGVLEDIGYF